MIYDNYDNPRIPGNAADRSAIDIRRFLPESDHGSIVITTRSSQVSQGHRIHVQKLLDVREGLEILSYTSGRKGIENDPAAIELVKELDGLPLALCTAGAYLEHVALSFSKYLQLYKTSWLKLQTTSPQLGSYEDRSLYTTWQITLNQIQQRNAASVQLLKLWAYFDRQDLWFELLRHGSSMDNEGWIQKLTEDELSFSEAIRLLCNYGLVDADLSFRQLSGSSGYSIHSCVHSWSMSVLNKEWDEKLARLAFTCIASEVPTTNEKNWWLLQRRLLQHATRLEHFIVDGKVDGDGMDWILHNLGILYSDQGKLAEAEAMYNRALQGKEEALGPKHLSTLHTVNNLGLLYADQGKLADAEAMCNRGLQGFEEALGLRHISTLGLVHNLGNLYKDQGKLAEAEAMYNRALQGCEEVLGLKHTLTLLTINNLGVLYADQGKLAEAEAMYNQALQGKEEALGPKHLSTLDTVNNLGLLYADQGKLADAEAMYNRALQGKEEALGPKHISILDIVNDLGNLYANQGKLAEAEAMYNRALQGREEALGLKHTSTLNIVNDLGLLYAHQGKLVEAEAMCNRALQGKEEALGPKHTLTLDTVNNLGLLYANQGKLAEAEAMYNRALQGYEGAIAPKFLSSYLPALNTMLNLGNLFSRTGRKDMAKVMYTRALSGYTIVQGPFSKRCIQIEGQLQALQLMPVETETPQHVPSEARMPKEKSRVRRLFHKLRT
ncbi:hypothetical protein GJ744_003308 [Endocarpon pusillum]|uniref:NB-ARC domain-containing protein n=1 Tax=Endocarpon pusillum TaxID=364733 RepID=A0A8H7AAY2_9EURO|nr:hypothetical protein GJ744_003308 [Endocarpon pusillum]